MSAGLDPQTDFHRRFNVSHLEPGLPRATARQAARHLLASALIYGAMLLVLWICPWTRNQLRIAAVFGRSALSWYGWAYITYLVIAPVVYFVWRPRSLWASKNLRIAGYLGRLVHRWRTPARQRLAIDWHPTYEETHAIAFLLIKLFYGPLMVCSTLTEVAAVREALQRMAAHLSPLETWDRAYVLLVRGVFLVDSFIYAASYHSESGLLKNKLRYAETRPLHIAVCLGCYPPFNMPTTALLGDSFHNPFIPFHGQLGHPLTWVVRGLVVVFLLLMLSSSLSLLTRASNLTNRGIVDWGPYRFVRHPGYLAKNLYWFVTVLPDLIPNTAIPGFTWSDYAVYLTVSVWGIVGWCTMYFLRAVTEERFLMRDPDYVAYCQKVRYRFIPGVY
jgi:protein-S-isoprenylcysteine O-methyltransferase Ste14